MSHTSGNERAVPSTLWANIGQGRGMPRRPIAFLLLAGYSALLLMATLGPVPQRLVGSEAPLGVLSLELWFEASTWTSGRLYEFVLNVLIFVPWGVLALIVLGERLWVVAALIGVALTVGIEIAQIPLPRISDPRDLVANTLGVLLGISFAVLVRTVIRAISPAAAAAGQAASARSGL